MIVINYIGIDPGLGGGITIIDENAKIIEKHIMPVISKQLRDYDIYKIYNMLHPYAGQIAGLEKSQVHPVSGKRACFMNGYGFGVLQTCLRILNISYMLVPPLVWMKVILHGIKHTDEKGSIRWAITNYPQENWRASPTGEKIHDGLTDSCAIAAYTRLLHLGRLQN